VKKKVKSKSVKVKWVTVSEIKEGYLPVLIPCFGCGKRAPRKTAYNGMYCRRCYVRFIACGLPARHSLTCAVPGCTNRTDRGDFVGDMCAPCHDYVVGKRAGGDRSPSQAYRNELVKGNLRLISAADARRRHVRGQLLLGSSRATHGALEDLRLLMTAVLNDNVDLLEKWNAALFVRRKHADRVLVHRQPFGGPLHARELRRG